MTTVDEDGKPHKLTTYCRFYQTQPVVRGILCLGFLDYPSCPDLIACRKNPRRVAIYEPPVFED